MKRGDVVAVAPPGDYGKPRPAVVVQTDALNDGGIGSVILCLFSSHLVEAPAFRITVTPNAENGLRDRSQIMVDKILTVRRDRIGPLIGRLEDETLVRLNRTLAFVIGLG